MSTTPGKKQIRGYEIVERIGSGGFGAVYRAYQPVLGREVAVKVILPTYANESGFIRRFETEARIVARLEHPYIVPLFDYWREPEGGDKEAGAYLVMRWLRGGNLTDKLKKAPLSLLEILQLIDQITAALSVAHKNDVIHRDIKPDNILLDEEGNYYLSDFGIALETEKDRIKEDDDQITGSVFYMAPEQLRGQKLTTQADIYSLGILLYEVLTGKYPFEGSFISDYIQKQLNDPLPQITAIKTDLPKEIDEVIQKATQKTPVDRYTDVREIATKLRAAIHATQEIRIFPVQDLDESLIITNPYKGLRAFDEGDKLDFFGREALVAALIERLKENHPLANFLAIIGPSGSGKSSVASAGLIPALKDGALEDSANWYYADMKPGDEPLKRLEAALLSKAKQEIPHLLDQLMADERGLHWMIGNILPNLNTRLVLLIDQFEEIFTNVIDEQERTHFLNLLQVAISVPDSHLHVIITLRADFYDKPLLYEGMGTLMEQRTHVVLPMTAEETERAITGPANRVGLHVNINLVTQIVADLRKEPGQLPLLQYALTELYERREGNILTLEAYQASGGVVGALARRADEVYIDLDDAEQGIARQVFLRLITIGEGVDDTRRRARLAELTALGKDRAVVQTVLDKFGKYRLLTFDVKSGTREPMVEIAHEALIREWRRLRKWLDDNRNDLRLERLLSQSIDEWENAGRQADFLLQGGRLEAFSEWAETTTLVLPAQHIAYMEASRQEKSRKDDEEKRRLENERLLERRAATRLRLVIGILSIGLIVAGILTALALNATNDAQAAQQTSAANLVAAVVAEETAARRADESQSLVWANSAQRAFEDRNPLAAYPIAIAANRIHNPPPLAQQTLADVAYTRGLRRIFQFGHTEDVRGLAFSPDGEFVISGSTDDSLILWEAATGHQMRRFTGHRDNVMVVSYSPDGATVLSGSVDFSAILWDVETGQQIRRFEAHTKALFGLDYSPDGTKILTGSEDATAIIWDIETGEMLHQLVGHAASVRQALFSPDGTRVATASEDATIILWDAATGEQLNRFEGHDDAIWTIDFSTDGSMLASGSSDTTVIIWDVNTGAVMHRFEDPQDTVWAVVFSPDDSQLYAGLRENTIMAWEITTETLRYTLQGHRDQVRTLAVHPQGHQLLSGSSDQSIIAWDTASGEIQNIFDGHAEEVLDVAFSMDQTRLLSASADHSLILWEVATGAQLQRFTGHTDDVLSVVFSADGQTALSASADQTLILWDAETGEIVRQFEGHTDAVLNARFSPDGESIASASNDGTLILWDVETGEQRRRFIGHTDRVTDVGFSPDGQHLFSSSADQTLLQWDIETGQALRRYSGHSDVVTSLAVDADGIYLVSGSVDRTVLIWEIESAQIVKRFDQHIQPVTDVALRADDAVLSSANDFSLNLTDFASLQVIQSFYGHSHEVINSVAFSPDDQFAVSGGRDFNIILWDMQVGAEKARLAGHTSTVNDLEMSADGQRVLSASADKSLILWDLTDNSIIRRFEGGHTGDIQDVAWSLDESQILSASDDGTLVLWDADTGEQIRTLRGHTNRVYSVEFSPDGRTAVSGSRDFVMFQWDLETGAIIREFVGHTAAIWSLDFSADGRRLISGSTDRGVFLWDVETATILRRFSGHTGIVWQAVFSPDEQYVLSGSTDNTLILWDAETGDPIHTLEGHTGRVLSVDFNSYGDIVVSSSEDGTVILWDVKSGQIIRRVQDFDLSIGWIHAAVFTPDGQSVLSGSYNHDIVIWDVDSLDALIKWTFDNRPVRELTCRERMALGITPLCDALANAPTMTPFITWTPTELFIRFPTDANVSITPTITPTIPTPTPTLTNTPPPTIDLTQMTATQTETPEPTVTATPTITLLPPLPTN